MPKVFISYRQENATHCERVKSLALQLRAQGVDVVLDQLAQEELFHGNQPTNGWGLWSIQQASDAPTVLIIGSPGWFRVINSPDQTADGKGAAAEASCVFQRLFVGTAVNDFAAILYFDYKTDLATLPTYFDTKCGRFDITKPSDMSRLLIWLQRPLSAVPAPPLGASPPPASLVSASADFPDPPRPPDRGGMVDCTQAFLAYEELLNRHARQRVLLLEGEGEHGKSSLIMLFYRHAQVALPGASSAFISFPENISEPPEHYLGTIADDVAVQAPTAGNIFDKSRALLQARAGLPTVLFVDHYERARPEHAQWLDLILRRTINQPLLRIVIAGRSVPLATAQPWGMYAAHCQCDPLADPDAFVQHAANCGSSMSPQDIKVCCTMLRNQRVARKAKGMATDGLSPLALLGEIRAHCPGGGIVV